MASSWGRFSAVAAVIAAVALPVTLQASASGGALLDPDGRCAEVEQGPMVHVFDTAALGGPAHYVNDHTLVQAHDGSWHLFGIYHREPIGEDTEIEFIHAVTEQADPAKWGDEPFEAAPEPWRIALRATPAAGETHLWAPHVVEANGRWVMIYQGGGADDYHATFRLAESDDLYRWTRVGAAPVIEDFCEARDPMLVRRDDEWLLYYTRCESIDRKISGVAVRRSKDLVHWSPAQMALTVPAAPSTSNSAYTESPFVFERGGYQYLSVTAYPLGWDETVVFRSRAPFAFPDLPVTQLRSHAGEWVFRGDRAWLTHAGPGQRGVWLSRIDGMP